ncbi:fam-a protein [Plasmodium vinckei]|uniref:Fam-a protein n=1 Tax=Plasmodium vinckei TaxID=5860 RepID=A0A6V7TAI0_PLAVN|nr:fam-a protein [Plasmodium vinckei]
MNKGYIKVTLALLCVAGYMQNIAFASETAVAINSSNVEYKQVSPDTEEVKQVSPDTEEVKQVSPDTEEVKQVSPDTEEVKQVSADTEGVKQQLFSTPNKAKQQVFSTPNKAKQQVLSTPNKAKQQVFSTPIVFKQKERFNPIEYKHQLSLKAKEGKHAEYIMAEALNIAKKHVEHTDDYKLYYNKNGATLHFKNFNDTEIGKLEFTIPNADNYADIVKMLWDPNAEKKFNDKFIRGSIARSYNDNLAIVQHRYKSYVWNKFYHAIANKVELSKDETAIVLTSSDMDDYCNSSLKNYVNPIVQSANSFKPDIDSEEDIRRARLTKFYINLMAIFIKKEADGVKITNICSINHDIFPDENPEQTLRNMTAYKMLSFTKLRNIIKKE